ncbi:MAG: ribosome assembly factor SBDS [archaeon]
MSQVIARDKIKGKNYELIVDCDKALEFKKTGNNIQEAVESTAIFTDHKKGLKASLSDLKDAFGTEDFLEIAGKIIKNGEIQLTQEHRDKIRDQKMKQIVTFLTTNCIDPRTNRPYTPTQIETAIKQKGSKIEENQDAATQALRIIRDLESILPLKMEVKKIGLTIPPEHTGKAFGLLQNFKKQKEEWKNDGSLYCILEIPAGMQLEFYDKLNAITHGSALTEEIQDE